MKRFNFKKKKKAACSDENSLLLETFAASSAEGLGEKVSMVTRWHLCPSGEGFRPPAQEHTFPLLRTVLFLR